MYDQGQYTSNKYHQLDADGVPIIIRGVDPKNYVIEKDQTWNPHTILQIDESQFTHVPEEKLHQQNAMVLPITAERLMYECFMIEEPQYVEEVTQMDNLLLMGALNPGMFGQGAGTSLLLWSRNRTAETMIRNSGVGIMQKVRELPIPPGSEGVRVLDVFWGLDTMRNYDPGLYRPLHEEYSQSKPPSWSSTLTRNLFQRMIKASGVSEQSLLNQVLLKINESAIDEGTSRPAEFKTLGEYLGDLGENLGRMSRTAKLLLWLLMPHATAESESDQKYEKIMWKIAYSVVYNRWPSESEWKGSELVGYTQQPVGGLIEKYTRMKNPFQAFKDATNPTSLYETSLIDMTNEITAIMDSNKDPNLLDRKTFYRLEELTYDVGTAFERLGYNKSNMPDQYRTWLGRTIQYMELYGHKK